MPIKSSLSCDIPAVTVPQYLFGDATSPLPEKPIIIDPERPNDRFLTLSTYRKWSQRIAAGLLKLGVQPGDRIMVVAASSLAFPPLMMGILMTGAILSGASPTLERHKLLDQAEELEPTLVFAVPEAAGLVADVAQSIGLTNDNIFLIDREDLFIERNLDHAAPGKEGPRSWRQLLDPSGDTLDWATTITTTPESLATINYTSGSTGHAKGVMATHRNIVANACHYITLMRSDPLSPENGHPLTWLVFLPMYHVMGQNQFGLICPKRGVTNYLMPSFTLDLFLHYIALHRPDEILIVPPLMTAMRAHPAPHKYDLSSVRNVLIGGAPLRLATLQRFEAFMPHPDCRCYSGFGMTELTCLGIYRSTRDRTSSETVGELMPNMEAKIVAPTGDATDELADPRAAGEILIRGPVVTKGYWRRPEVTARAFGKDGWLRTGDLGFCDERGYWMVKDRLADVIPLANGEGYMLPTDLESTLLGIQGVADAGVTILTKPENGAKVARAFVVLSKEPGAPTLLDVKAAFEKAAKPYERFEGGLYEIDHVPKLPSGKVHRPALREVVVESP